MLIPGGKVCAGSAYWHCKSIQLSDLPKMILSVSDLAGVLLMVLVLFSGTLLWGSLGTWAGFWGSTCINYMSLAKYVTSDSAMSMIRFPWANMGLFCCMTLWYGTTSYVVEQVPNIFLTLYHWNQWGAIYHLWPSLERKRCSFQNLLCQYFIRSFEYFLDLQNMFNVLPSLLFSL